MKVNVTEYSIYIKIRGYKELQPLPFGFWENELSQIKSFRTKLLNRLLIFLPPPLNQAKTDQFIFCYMDAFEDALNQFKPK